MGENIPRSDLAFAIDAESQGFDCARIAKALQLELGRNGYTGDFREVDPVAYELSENESLVRVRVTRSDWRTKKACTVPYLLNCYRKVYTVRVLVEIPHGDNGPVSRSICVDGASAVETQFLQNDKYDPDLLLDQTQRLSLEEAVCAKLAKQLLGYISRNLE